MTVVLMNATIRLFNALMVEKPGVKKKQSKELLSATLAKGFVFSPSVVANYSEKELFKMVDEIGLSPEQMNASFHKSWGKVKNAPTLQLVLEQMLHYMTTYGAEAFGVYDEANVYVPFEKLALPASDGSIPIKVIKGMSKQELRDRLVALLNTGIALKDDTIVDVLEVIKLVKFTKKQVLEIKNKEVKVCLLEKLGIVPEDPVEFLRLAVYSVTKQTLLIKNQRLVNAIKKQPGNAQDLFNKYVKEYGRGNLAAIFNRFKPIFLAFKKNAKMNTLINHLGKLSKKHHVPMPENFVDSITARIKNNTLDLVELERRIKPVPLLKKAKIAYALNYRLSNPKSIVYKVRNGRAYAAPFKVNHLKRIEAAYEVVYALIVEDVKRQVKGKKIFIPSNVSYALPSTEKQFVGNFPAGTTVTVPSNMVFGVHWNDVNGSRIDLDLSLITEDGKIGWDRNYSSADKKILFSGDMTSAPLPKGASELFYVAKQFSANYLVMLNYFNHSSTPVPFDIVVAKEKVAELNHDYVLNPNNLIATAAAVIKDKQSVLGLINVAPDKTKFCFVNYSIGESITAHDSETADNNREYIVKFYSNTISLNKVLKSAGAILVDDVKEADVDLSMDKLEKDTILNLLIEKK